MARQQFGGGLADWTFAATSGGVQVIGGITVLCYSAETGGTQYTDLRTITGVAISSVVSSNGSDGRAIGTIPPFQGPDGIKEMWVSASSGPRARMVCAGDVDTAVALATVKGDMMAASGPGVPARLAVGTNGQALIANSALTLGVGWASPFDPTAVRKSAIEINVKDYGATGGGVTNDAAFIQIAINTAAGLGGGVVYFPPGMYMINATLLINGNNITLEGSGFGSVIKLMSGANCTMVSTPTDALNGTEYTTIRNLYFDGDKFGQTLAAAGTCHGVRLFGSKFGCIENCYFDDVRDWAISANGVGGGPTLGQYGWNNRYTGNVVDLCGGSIYIDKSEAEYIAFNTFKWADGVDGVEDYQQGHITATSGGHTIIGNVFGEGGTYLGGALMLLNDLSTRVIGNRFDHCRNEAIRCTAGNAIIIGNDFGSCGIHSAIANDKNVIELGGPNCQVLGNHIFSFITEPATFKSAIAEVGVLATNNIIANNTVMVGVGSAQPAIVTVGANTRVSGNIGFNPIGKFASQPAVPATTVPFVNNKGADATVHIAGGTVTVVAVGGQATGATTGTFRVSAGQSITLTYSVAPTWTWFGD